MKNFVIDGYARPYGTLNFNAVDLFYPSATLNTENYESFLVSKRYFTFPYTKEKSTFKQVLNNDCAEVFQATLNQNLHPIVPNTPTDPQGADKSGLSVEVVCQKVIPSGDQVVAFSGHPFFDTLHGGYYLRGAINYSMTGYTNALKFVTTETGYFSTSTVIDKQSGTQSGSWVISSDTDLDGKNYVQNIYYSSTGPLVSYQDGTTRVVSDMYGDNRVLPNLTTLNKGILQFNKKYCDISYRTIKYPSGEIIDTAGSELGDEVSISGIQTDLASYVPPLILDEPNPFYAVFNKDGSNVKIFEMPHVTLNGYEHILSPLFSSTAPITGGFLSVGGYIGKVSNCFFRETSFPISYTRTLVNKEMVKIPNGSYFTVGYKTFQAMTATGTTLLPHEEYGVIPLRYGYLKDYLNEPANPANFADYDITSAELPNYTFTFSGSFILKSGGVYKGVPIPYLNQQASDIVYRYDNTSMEMSILGNLPEPLLGSSLISYGDEIIAIGGVTECPEDWISWTQIQPVKSVYLITNSGEITKLPDTQNPHAFAATRVIDSDKILIVSGEKWEVYSKTSGSVKQGNLLHGGRRGSYIHKVVVDAYPQYIVIGGWEYAEVPFQLKTTQFGYLENSNYGKISARPTYEGTLVDGSFDLNAYHKVIDVFINTIPVVGSGGVSINTDQDLSKAIFYQLDYDRPILLEDYTLTTGSLTANRPAWNLPKVFEVSGISSWALYGSNDSNDWVKLDEKFDVSYTVSNQPPNLNDGPILHDFTYPVTAVTKYRYYRFYIFKTFRPVGTEEVRLNISFGSQDLKSLVPLKFMGLAQPLNQPSIPQTLLDGWWAPNLDFLGEPVNHTLRDFPYKYNNVAIKWNETSEVLSDIQSTETPLIFSSNAYDIDPSMDIVLTLDPLVATCKSRLVYKNIYQQQIEIPVTTTSVTIPKDFLDGVTSFNLYVIKEDNVTYMKQIKVNVIVLNISLNPDVYDLNIGESAYLNPLFNYGTGVITPGDIVVTSGEPVLVTPSGNPGDMVTYTLTVTIGGVTFETTTSISLSASVPTLEISGIICDQLYNPEGGGSYIITMNNDGDFVPVMATYDGTVSEVTLRPPGTLLESGVQILVYPQPDTTTAYYLDWKDINQTVWESGRIEVVSSPDVWESAELLTGVQGLTTPITGDVVQTSPLLDGKVPSRSYTFTLDGNYTLGITNIDAGFMYGCEIRVYDNSHTLITFCVQGETISQALTAGTYFLVITSFGVHDLYMNDTGYYTLDMSLT